VSQVAFGNVISDEGAFIGFNRADFSDACLLSLVVEVERMALAEKETEWNHRQELEHVETDCKRTKQYSSEVERDNEQLRDEIDELKAELASRSHKGPVSVDPHHMCPCVAIVALREG